MAVDELEPGFILIHDAARIAKCKLSEILKLISDGDIRSVVQSRKQRGIRALAVTLDELLDALPKFENVGVPREQAARALHASQPTIKLLLDLKYLEPVKARRNETRYLCEMISFESLNEFARTRISLGELAEKLDRTPGPLLLALKAKGIKPIGTFYGKRASSFFLRKDIPSIRTALSSDPPS